MELKPNVTEKGQDLKKKQEGLQKTIDEVFTKWPNVNSMHFYNLDPFEKGDFKAINNDFLEHNNPLDLEEDEEDKESKNKIESLRNPKGKVGALQELEARSKYFSYRRSKVKDIINEFGEEKFVSFIKDTADLLFAFKQQNKLLSYKSEGSSFDFFKAGNYIVQRAEIYDERLEQKEYPDIRIEKIENFTKKIKSDLEGLKSEADYLQKDISLSEELLKKIENVD